MANEPYWAETSSEKARARRLAAKGLVKLDATHEMRQHRTKRGWVTRGREVLRVYPVDGIGNKV